MPQLFCQVHLKSMNLLLRGEILIIVTYEWIFWLNIFFSPLYSYFDIMPRFVIFWFFSCILKILQERISQKFICHISCLCITYFRCFKWKRRETSIEAKVVDSSLHIAIVKLYLKVFYSLLLVKCSLLSLYTIIPFYI